MSFVGAIGGMLGGFFATNIGSRSPNGWRYAFHLMALISIVTGLLVWRCELGHIIRLHGPCPDVCPELSNTVWAPCRYAADSKQHSSSKKHNAPDAADSERQGDSDPARWRDKLNRPGPIADELRSKPLSLDASLKGSSASSSLVRALLDMQRTIGSVLVIPTFRIVVLQVRPVVASSLCLLPDPIICMNAHVAMRS